jgi:hypothetical protein
MSVDGEEEKKRKRKRKKPSGRDEDGGLCALPAMPLQATLYLYRATLSP